MIRSSILLISFLMSLSLTAQKRPKIGINKKAVIAAVEKQQEKMITMSDQIWALAEMAFEEKESSKILADYAESQGFIVERAVAGMPTAFVATYGSGKPVIGVLGEFDALPGISQKATSAKEPLKKGAGGHGCGHNLFGVGSLAAAVAIKDLIAAGKLKGTIKFYGTPAEEKFFGKLFMAREGLFNDLDVCLDWHPSDEIKANVQSGLALVDFIVEFNGQAAHAAGDPWNGRSAVDALELYTTGINYLREHIKPSVRIHYHIQHGGDVVNVVPDYAKLWVRVRDTKREDMQQVWKRVEKMAEGAAIMANVDYKISLVSGLHEVLVNRTGGAALQKNLEYLGDITYTDKELAFAHGIQEVTGKPKEGIDAKVRPMEETKEHPGGGSTDVGDVSWLVPEIRLGVTTAPKGTPWHSWAVVACGGMSIGHKGMVHAAKALSMTMVDLYENQKLIQNIQIEFKERKGDYQYKAILPEGPPPIPIGSN
ncbi:amidohydrolase [Aquimarina sp. MMG016]|uniref:amidohydrolase n=1 Tax=Aquimarina sp. MMG016 TaxID=2822690 RepID=UPI001B39D517|nr:amidohydrolase [Aquimarina sp. MMG016]MBQ4818800.1 amidohydrolase [Aquimarina sp. MMG016]